MSKFLQTLKQVYEDKEFAKHFDERTAITVSKLAKLTTSVTLIVTVFIVSISSLDAHGFLAESLYLVFGSFLLALFAAKVPAEKVQIFFGLGFFTILCGVDLISAYTNGSIYMDRPVHPGFFHMFIILSATRIRLKVAVVISIAGSMVLFLAAIYTAPESAMLPKFLAHLMLANIFGHTVNSFLYVEEWREFQAKKQIIQENFRTDSILANILPSEVSEKLKLSRNEPLIYKREKVSVLVMDLVGYSEWVQSCDDNILIQTLNSLYARLDAATEKHNATKIKTLGDAYVVVTGLTSESGIERDCYDTALEFSRTIQEFNKSHGTNFKSRIGIATGPAIFGVIGRNRPKFDIWGHTFVEALAKEKACPIDGVSMCEVTKRGCAA